MTYSQKFALYWRRFSPLEERLFAAVRTALPEGAKSIYDAQLTAIHHVQRLLEWNEICYYPKIGWLRRRVRWDRVPKFPREDEFPLAEVGFKVNGRSYKATLSAIQGHVFDFHIHPGGRTIAFSAWDAEPCVTLLNDPLHVLAEGSRHKVSPRWNQFLGEHRGEGISHWKLYDETSARCVALEDGEYLLLAENNGEQFVLERIDPASEQIFYMQGHDGVPRAVDGELTSIIRETS